MNTSFYQKMNIFHSMIKVQILKSRAYTECNKLKDLKSFWKAKSHST
jgi:hypothetical protein